MNVSVPRSPSSSQCESGKHEPLAVIGRPAEEEADDDRHWNGKSSLVNVYMGAILSLHVNVNVPDFFKEGGGYT